MTADTPEPMSEERLREIEARVAARPHGSALWDDHCEWLYDVASFAPALLAEIARLRKELHEAKAAAKVMADCHAHLEAEARAERAEKALAEANATMVSVSGTAAKAFDDAEQISRAVMEEIEPTMGERMRCVRLARAFLASLDGGSDAG